MYLVGINNVKPGQVVAKAVTNAGGAILCPPGFKLSETAIQSLKNAGVDSVVLEGEGDDTERCEQRIRDLQERFEGIDDPIMLQLKAAVERRLGFMGLQKGSET